MKLPFFCPPNGEQTLQTDSIGNASGMEISSLIELGKFHRQNSWADIEVEEEARREIVGGVGEVKV